METDERVAAAYLRQEVRKIRKGYVRNGDVLMIITAGLSMQAATGDRYFAESVVGAVFAFVFALFNFLAAAMASDPKNQASLAQHITDRATVRAARQRAKDAARD